MKTLFAALALIPLLTDCQSARFANRVTSVTTIPASKEFNLGDNSHGPFSAQVKNIGSVAVLVNQRQADGKQLALGELKPGDSRSLTFDAQSSAVFVNVSPDQSAELSLVLKGDLNLSMGYTNGK
ncbi:hypothetical protein [Fibrella arboris]|uniref:hypothetical protein n=1 Tax=Fibrella arboris TaxID=3242486 RepID=UPI00352192CC